MTRYTWTVRPGTRTREYRDSRREITAVIYPGPEGGWEWRVAQWGRTLAGDPATYLADARTAAETWIATLTEVTPA